MYQKVFDRHFLLAADLWPYSLYVLYFMAWSVTFSSCSVGYDLVQLLTDVLIDFLLPSSDSSMQHSPCPQSQQSIAEQAQADLEATTANWYVLQHE